jgi:hypothetical protein
MSIPPPEIEVCLWPFKLMVRGTSAIAVVRWPLTAILVAIAISILATVVFEALCA